MLLELANFYECFFISVFIGNYFQMKKNYHKGYLIVLSLLLYLEIHIINRYLVYCGYFSIIYIITIFIFTFIFSNNSIPEQLFITIGIFCCISTLNNMVLFNISILKNSSFINIARNINEHFEIIIISRILFTIVVWMAIKLRKSTMILLSESYWYILSFVSGVSYIVFSIMQDALFMGVFNNREILIGLVSLIILNISLLILFFRLVNESNNQTRDRLMVIAMKHQQNSAVYAENLNIQTKKLKHDLKHVLNVVGTFLRNKQYQEAEELLAEYLVSVEEVPHIIQTGNTLFDYILYEKQFQAKMEGIQLYVNILNINYCGIKDIHLCMILGNLLDNAIENCSQKERKINLEISKVAQYLKIVVKNKVDENVIANNPNLESSKENKEQHGYGLESVKSIAAIYEGSLLVKEENNEFQSIVLLNMRPISAEK